MLFADSIAAIYPCSGSQHVHITMCCYMTMTCYAKLGRTFKLMACSAIPVSIFQYLSNIHHEAIQNVPKCSSNSIMNCSHLPSSQQTLSSPSSPVFLTIISQFHFLKQFLGKKNCFICQNKIFPTGELFNVYKEKIHIV